MAPIDPIAVDLARIYISAKLDKASRDVAVRYQRPLEYHQWIRAEVSSRIRAQSAERYCAATAIMLRK